jgi:hypothetical protein
MQKPSSMRAERKLKNRCHGPLSAIPTAAAALPPPTTAPFPRTRTSFVGDLERRQNTAFLSFERSSLSGLPWNRLMVAARVQF